MEITFTMSDANAIRVVRAVNALHPKPVEEAGLTDAQWTKEFLRRWIVGRVQKHEKQLALSAVSVPFEDDLVT